LSIGIPQRIWFTGKVGRGAPGRYATVICRGGRHMITGVHAIIYTKDAEADRAFFRDVLGFPWVDAGQGWLIFALPPAELAAHPTVENGHCALYLMCDDVRKTVAELMRKGAEITQPITEQS
jgi:predicted enzyme related to lactoylglutathione lyase